MAKILGILAIIFIINSAVLCHDQSAGEKKPPLTQEVNVVFCPEQGYVCPDNNTCCIMPGGTVGCCSLPNAVCCSDGEHCCPQFMTCDLEEQICRSQSSEHTPKQEKTQVNNIICPDGDQCPDNNTCCKMSSGRFGCCPFSNAVCCPDGIYCCPEGYACGPSSGLCYRGNQPPKQKEIKDVVCPGGEYECADGQTCCPLSSGVYGCCPVPNAVCCSDGEHCCPEGYTCDVAEGTCQLGNQIPVKFLKKSFASMSRVKLNTKEASKVSLAPLKKLAEPKKEEKNTDVKAVICPGGQYSCADGQTCCPLSSGVYGCCPVPNAVCCSDGEHCCPEGYTCDVAEGLCQLGKQIPLKFLKKSLASKVSLAPLKKLAEPKKEEKNTDVKAVICPGGQYSCADGQTCCPLSSGVYGCCPVPNAVCCSDGEHCCPEGYTCDVAEGLCQLGKQIPLKFLKKSLASKVSLAPLKKLAEPKKEGKNTDVKAVICPGGQYSCADGQTCCPLSSGVYGCCPVPNAVCCSDGEHCCPEGYTCDVAEGLCQLGKQIPLKFLKKSLASKVSLAPLKKLAEPKKEGKNTDVKAVICPGGQYSCADGQTCCPLSSGVYGCCPVPNAVCCSDGEHCCPEGYTCDVAEGLCQLGKQIPLKFLKKSLASKVSLAPLKKLAEPKKEEKNTDVKAVICPGGQYYCGDGQTCCPNLAGGWNCCPLPSAVCCQDHVHCCPYATWCNPTTLTCNRSSFMKMMIPHSQKAQKLQ